MTAMDHLALFYTVGIVMSLGPIGWFLWQKHHR